MLRNLLLMQMTVVTVVGASLTAWAHMQGYVVPIFATDDSYLSYVAVALFLGLTVSAFIRAAKVGAAMDEWKSGKFTGYALCYVRRKASKMDIKNDHLRDGANWLLTLGILGTVIGFYIALGGKASNDDAAVTAGVLTAIGTTIVGGFLSLWMEIYRRLIETATLSYMEDVR